MPWLRWKRRLPIRPGAVLLGAGVAAALSIAGCATGGGPAVPERRLPPEDQRYVLPPLTGYPLTVPLSIEAELNGAAARLSDSRAWSEVRQRAEALLAENPGLHPAIVLAAQVDFAERRHAEALERLRPVNDELPAYDAARMLTGRVAEALGDVPLAYGSFSAVADRRELAAARAAQLHERAVEIVSNRVHDALGRGRLDEAAEDVEQLVAWAPGEAPTLRAQRAYAVAGGDLESELTALRQLSRLEPRDRALQERTAELEVEVGEPATGLRLFQALAARYPEDPELAEKLAEAEFVWRLTNVPDEAKRLIELSELTRGDFAAILYWLFPDIRYGRTAGGRIANDIFDHPAREQIVRVVNMELMRVDQRLHSFEPDRPVSRLEALESFLGLLHRRATGVACLGTFDPRLNLSTGAVCETAARCGLIEETAACFPGASLSGAAAARMSRRTLEQLGVE